MIGVRSQSSPTIQKLELRSQGGYDLEVGWKIVGCWIVEVMLQHPSNFIRKPKIALRKVEG